MKNRVVILLLALLFCIYFTVDLGKARVDAQTKKPRPAPSSPSDKDLFKLISSLTNRTSDGLTETALKGNGTTVALDGRYQNVMLAQLDASGEPVVACITDTNEANGFFKRDLATGAPVAAINFVGEDKESIAKRHGMTVEEFDFYSRMASDYFNGNIIASPGSATFNIVNADGAGEGFNDATPAFVVGEGGNNGATRGQQRLNVFNAAAAVWASFLDSPVPTNVSSQFNPLTPCTSSGGVLGSAGTLNVHRNFSNAEYAATWYHAALANKLAGTDLVPANPEIQAQFNSDVDNSCLGGTSRFYYGLDNATPSQRINLFVVLLHEIGHGVGFSSFVNGSTGVYFGTPANPDVYSKFMFDQSVGLYWDQMTNAQRATSALNTNNVFWDGANVRSASGYLTAGRDALTGRVALFTPNPLQSGSSISHFSTAATPSLLMEPSITSGLPLNLDLTRQVMRDIGWYRDTTADGVADTITTVTPNNSYVVIGDSQPINWVNNGGFSRNVTIELSTDGGVTYSAIATDVANTGTFPWVAPNTPTVQARIRVREAGFVSPAGVSSANFSILASPAASSATVAGRVFDPYGRALARTTVILRASNGTVYVDRTNSFGYFQITGLPTGSTYFADVSAKGYRFDTVAINVDDNISGLEFRAVN